MTEEAINYETRHRVSFRTTGYYNDLLNHIKVFLFLEAN